MYTCGHCQEVDVALPPVLQKKEGRLSGRTASQVLKAQCKRCERGRGIGPAGLPTGAEDDAVPQFRVEIPLGRCAECRRLKQPEEQCGERDALRCGGVLIDLSSARDKLEEAVPIAVGARQLLQWVQMPPQAKPQRILLMSARPETPGGDLACSVVEKVRKATGWSPFVLALLAWTLGCVAYAFRQKPENPSLNPDLLYEQFQRRIEDIPVPQSSPQYQQYRQYYLRQYEEHLQEYSVMNAQWRQNRPLFNWQAFVQGMGVGLLVFAAALAFCEYHYGTISCWMELAEELWYVWQERWSKWWDPLGDSQKMERFLQEMGEEPKKSETSQVEAAASARQPSTPPKTAPPPPPPPPSTPQREGKIEKDEEVANAGTSTSTRRGRQTVVLESSPEPLREPSPEHALEEAPAAASPSAAAPPSPAPPRSSVVADGSDGGKPRAEPARQAATPAPPRPAQTSAGQSWEAPDLPGVSSVPQSRMSGRSGQDALGSNVRERLRRKVIERNREQIRQVVTQVSEPPRAAYKAPQVVAEDTTRHERPQHSSRAELLREAEELLCQLEAESLLKQLAEEEERKRASAQKKRAKNKPAERGSKGAEPGPESDSNRESEPPEMAKPAAVEGAHMDQEPKDAEVVTTTCSEDSEGDDSAEPEEVPSVESVESLPPAEPEESLPSVEQEEDMMPPATEPEECQPAVEPEAPSPRGCVVDEPAETVVAKGRKRQRHRPSRQAQANAAARRSSPHDRVVGGGPPSSPPADAQLGSVSTPEKASMLPASTSQQTPQSSTALRIKNTFFELPEEFASPEVRPRARSAPCRPLADTSGDDEDAPGADAAAVAPGTPPAAATLEWATARDRRKATKAAQESARAAQREREAEERAQRLRREAERRERRDPKRLGVWDDLPRASCPSQPAAPTTRRRDVPAAIAKEEPRLKTVERKDKNRPGVWDDLPPRTQSGPLPAASKTAANKKPMTPLGPVLSKEAGAAAGASILQVLRGSGPSAKAPTPAAGTRDAKAPAAAVGGPDAKAPMPAPRMKWSQATDEEEWEEWEEVRSEHEEEGQEPSRAAECDAEGEQEAKVPAKSVTLRADAPEFVPAPPLASVEPMPGQALMPAMFVIGPNQQMVPVQVLPMPLPEGAHLLGQMGPVPMADGMQGQAVPLLQQLPLPGQLPEEGLPATPHSGEVAPSSALASDDVLAQQMEMLRMKLHFEEQQPCFQEQLIAADNTILEAC